MIVTNYCPTSSPVGGCLGLRSHPQEQPTPLNRLQSLPLASITERRAIFQKNGAWVNVIPVIDKVDCCIDGQYFRKNAFLNAEQARLTHHPLMNDNLVLTGMNRLHENCKKKN